MDKKYIQENEIDIKYLRGQLSDDELELFEIYLMENPEYLDTLEVDSVLLASEPQSFLQLQPESQTRSLWEALTRSLNPVFAMTFSVLAIAVVATFYLPTIFQGNGEYGRTGIYTAELENVRSAGPRETQNILLLDKIDESNQVNLTFFLPDEYEEVEVTLLEVSGDMFSGCDTIQEPVAKKKVGFQDLSYSFFVPSSMLSEGNYTVCVSNTAGLINHYKVSVVKEK